MFTYFAEGSFKILVGFGLILQTRGVELAASLFTFVPLRRFDGARAACRTLHCKFYDANGIYYPVK
jgi:hypothetical protein